jgi:prepilin-type N-terminal cleavage/methylation domain-containing protein
MGISPKTLSRRPSGFTIVEILTVLTVSSILLVTLAALFKTGLWEVSRSSGRIEVLRQGRQALDNMQRYLASAVQPSNLTEPSGDPVTAVIYTPDQIFDPNAPDPTTNPPPTDRIRFFTPVDHLTGAPAPGARQLQTNPINYAYEMVVVPGANNLGQDLVLRRLDAPTNANPYPLLPDVTIQPRYLARRLGVPDAAAPGGYRDGLVVQRWREGALQIRVNVSSDLITDDTNRTRTENATPLRITMSTIYQPPIFNVQ